MQFNPHSLHQVLIRIREQMRCPQCSTPIPVDFASVKLAGDDFMILQLQCNSCHAFIVLHVNLVEPKSATPVAATGDDLLNASSTLSLSEDEMKTLKSALANANGSFSKLFEGIEEKE